MKQNYIMDSKKNCIYCGDRCNYCKLDANNKPICLSCESSAFLDNGKCLFCNNGCNNCTIDPKSKYKNETICSGCKYNYIFNASTNNCTSCSKIPQLGDGM